MHTEPNSPPESTATTTAPAPTGFVLTNPEPQPHEPTHVGELLAQAREHAGMSIGDVANRLRMSVKQIEALERADYAVLPAGTFLRGFVRNFAKAVGLNADEALKVLERTHTDGLALNATGIVAPTIAAAPVAFQSQSDALATPKSRAMIAVLLVACLMAVVWYWWEFVRPHRAEGGRPPEAQTIVVQPTVIPSQAQAVPAAAADPSTEPAPATLPSGLPPLEAAQAAIPPAASLSGKTPVANTPVANTPVGGGPGGNAPEGGAPGRSAPAGGSTTSVATPPKPTPPPVVAKPAEAAVAEKLPAAGAANSPAKKAGDTGLIGFTFSGESWVEVIDGTGRTVMSRRYKAGDADQVSGRGPFSIVVGNAQSTRMAYNGREFDLAPHTKATVARVTVK